MLIAFLKNWTLPVAIAIGTAFFWGLRYLAFLIPYLIFAMLFLSFCRIPLKDIHFGFIHLALAGFQVIGGMAVFYLLTPFDVLAAETALVCMMTPTGTAAAVITQKLGGNAASMTGYMLISNLLAAIAVPLCFPIAHPMTGGIGFFTACLIILGKVGPMIVIPMIAAMLLRRFSPKTIQYIVQWPDMPFYLLGFSLMLVVARTVDSLVKDSSYLLTVGYLAIAAAIICCMLFVLGKWIGSCFGQRIVGGQALGQKNVVLAIWMAHTYLFPIVAMGATAYIVWQNLFNAWQLWRQRITDQQQAQ